MELEHYSHLAFFCGLCPDELQILEPLFTRQSWVAGTSIFEQGDPASNLYLVVSGEVTILFKPHDGPVMVVTHIPPGGIFGWSAVTGNPSYTSGARCKLDCEVLTIMGADLRTLCEKQVGLGKLILERLSALIAERQRNQLVQVNTILNNGMRHHPEN